MYRSEAAVAEQIVVKVMGHVPPDSRGPLIVELDSHMTEEAIYCFSRSVEDAFHKAGRRPPVLIVCQPGVRIRTVGELAAVQALPLKREESSPT